MQHQQTLKRAVVLIGIGLHTGKDVRLTLKPARPNHGIVFVRTDLEGAPAIPAHFENVTSTQMATTLSKGGASVSTVEHLMAAFEGMGVDNAIVEVDGPEIPIMDGSSGAFCKLLIEAGIEEQPMTRACLALRRRVEVQVAGKFGYAEPSSRFEIHATVEWDHPAIGAQEYMYVQGRNSFAEFAGARTFGFLRDVEALKRMGLARGGSLENAVVLDDTRVLNPEGLRYENEFARHKVLDALGDFKLAGIGIRAFFRLHRAGHDLHRQLLAEIFKDPNNFEIIEPIQTEEKAASRVRAAIASARWAAAL